ncbi:hypothetical protein [Enterococcus alishanensis]
MKKKIKLMNTRHILFSRLIIIFILMTWFSYWAFKIKFNQAPDEYMRYLIPTYIFNYGKLPTGYSKEAMYVLGNWSYAFYPQFLGAIVSSIFMKIFAIFTHSYQLILFAARLTSVFFSGIALYFTGKSVSVITKNNISGLFAMILMGLIPQYTYLSSYVNNDIIAISGVAIISYCMLDSAFNSWEFKHSVLLSFGFMICALGYLNSYGFILMGGIYFLFIQLYQIKTGATDWKFFTKQTVFIFLFELILVIPFFARNYYLYKDFFGTKIFNQSFNNWKLRNPNWRITHPSLAMRKPFNGTLIELFKNKEFLTYTNQSFIGVFSYMNIFMSEKYYYIYNSILGFGSLLGSIRVLDSLRVKVKNRLTKTVAFISLLAASIITISLFIVYVMKTDYQPQGRYIYSLIPILILLVVCGIDFVLNILKAKFSFFSKATYTFLTIFLIYMNLIVFMNYITQTFVPSNVTENEIELYFDNK